MATQAPKLVVVVGATGTQGSSVVNRLISSPEYRLRGITRDTQSTKALDLAARGVEMVMADLNDVESLKMAFRDAQIIFAYTNFFETFATSGPVVAAEVETKQGTNLAIAASATPSLEHYIWSTLPSRQNVSGGKHFVPHCDAKAEVDIFIKQDGNLLPKTTFMWPAWFAEIMRYPMFAPNLIESTGKHIWLQPAPSSTPVFSLGSCSINIGHFVYAIITQPSLTLATYVFAFTEQTTMGALLTTWGEVTGNETEYIKISLGEYDRLWPMWGLEVGKDLACSADLGDSSWGGERWIGPQELGLAGNSEMVGFREAQKAWN